MTFSTEITEIIARTISYAKKEGLEYITPELLLFETCREEAFIDAFTDCGGSIRKLMEDLEANISETVYSAANVNPGFSDSAEFVLAYAGEQAASSGKEIVGISHLIHALFQLKDSYAVYFIRKQDIEEADLIRSLIADEYDEGADDDDKSVFKNVDDDYDDIDDDQDIYSDVEDGRRSSIRAGKISHNKSGSWEQYAPCMNDMLENVNPLIGRDKEVERTIQILCRKDKNNPLHIGEPGVGKTAITYGLARLINENKVPEELSGAKIFMMDLGGMLAGTQYRGDFEKRFKRVLREIEKEDKPIIYIDEIHNLYGAGATGEGSYDASNMLKPYLTEGHIRFIGATTYEEYKKYFEKSKSLVRRFQNVEISEPTVEETVDILKGLKPRYEEFHNVKYADGILEYAAQAAKKYINERFLPDKAIDLIDEAGSYRKLHPVETGQDRASEIAGSVQEDSVNPDTVQDHSVKCIAAQIVDKETINKVLTDICRVPIETVETDGNEGLINLEENLKKQIFGQDEAITQVTNAVKFSKAGLLEDGKPLASLLFVGPTGVGKTEIARQLAEQLGVKLIRFDMSEYEEKYAVSKLIGASAGYIGYENGGLLTEAVRKNPSAVLLLDEIEKAHEDIYNILLQVMDYATLTDNQGRKADFRNVIIIMTSNIGADKVGQNTIGFHSERKDKSVMMEDVKKSFKPEFRNRLSRIVIFNSMSDEMASSIIEKMLCQLEAMLKARNIELKTDEKAFALIKKKGINEEYGAREVERVIRNEIKPLFVDSILFGELKHGGKIKLSAEDESFIVMSEE